MTLRADPCAVAEARRQVKAAVRYWHVPVDIDVAELLVSELVTNAIRHANEPVQLRIILDGLLSCEVFDGSSSAPQLGRADRFDEDGRGLMLVAQLAERWGTRHTGTG